MTGPRGPRPVPAPVLTIPKAMLRAFPPAVKMAALLMIQHGKIRLEETGNGG